MCVCCAIHAADAFTSDYKIISWQSLSNLSMFCKKKKKGDSHFGKRIVVSSTVNIVYSNGENYHLTYKKLCQKIDNIVHRKCFTNISLLKLFYICVII